MAFLKLVSIQVIPGNSPKHVSTNRGLLRSKITSSFASRRAQSASMSVLGPSNRKFQILKLFFMFKRTNEKGRQSLRRFPGSEITRIDVQRNLQSDAHIMKNSRTLKKKHGYQILKKFREKIFFLTKKSKAWYLPWRQILRQCNSETETTAYPRQNCTKHSPRAHQIRS